VATGRTGSPNSVEFVVAERLFFDAFFAGFVSTPGAASEAGRFCGVDAVDDTVSASDNVGGLLAC